MELHRKYGDFVRIGPNHVSINNPGAIPQIYGHRTGFTKGPFYDAFVQVTPVVFNVRSVEEHVRKRKYINASFSSRALLDFEPYMDREILGWKRKLFGMLQENKANLDFVVWSRCFNSFTVRKLLTNGYFYLIANFLAFDVVASFAFGSPFGFVETGKDPDGLIQIIDARGEFMNATGSLSSILRPLMRYHPFDSFWRQGYKARAGLESIGREAYQRRKSSTGNRKDLMSYLLAATDPSTKKSIDEDEIIAESISFIVGGSDTTSSTMTNFIDFVSRDTKLQFLLQQELDSFFPGEPAEDWVPSERETSRLPLMVATLREVMRVRPTSATGLERITPMGGQNVVGQFIPSKVRPIHWHKMKSRSAVC
jgi:benzoate 4-monooxygenase